MNLTILALQTSIISISPLFTRITSLNIQRSTFSYLSSPLIYNSLLTVESTSFFKGLSSIIIIEKEFTTIVKHLSRGESFEFKNNIVKDFHTSQSLIYIDGEPSANGISICQNEFYDCISQDKTGLIVVSCDTNTVFNSNCLASSYSDGATTLNLVSTGTISFITTITGTSSNADCVFAINSLNYEKDIKFTNNNISNSNLLQYGAIDICSGSKLDVKFLHFESSYNNYCFRIQDNTQFSLQNCELFDLTVDFSIFLSYSSFSIRDSYFFGLIFDNFINTSSSLKYQFINCGFDISSGLLKESFISFNDCFFDMEITFTNNAEFLKYSNCDGRNFSTYESIKKSFATEEILGILFCIIGIVLSLILIIAQLLRLTTNEDQIDNSDDQDLSDYSYSTMEDIPQDIDDEKPRSRNRSRKT